MKLWLTTALQWLADAPPLSRSAAYLTGRKKTTSLSSEPRISFPSSRVAVELKKEKNHRAKDRDEGTERSIAVRSPSQEPQRNRRRAFIELVKREDKRLIELAKGAEGLKSRGR